MSEQLYLSTLCDTLTLRLSFLIVSVLKYSNLYNCRSTLGVLSVLYRILLPITYSKG